MTKRQIGAGLLVVVAAHIGLERTLTPDRFRRIQGVGVDRAQELFDEARNAVINGVPTPLVDADGLRQLPMPKAGREFGKLSGVDSDAEAQFVTSMAGHVFSEEFKVERVNFFLSYLP